MNTPKISVIIPTYNRANLIKNTIKGVINQTYTDWELLIVDDGSTDNTKEIVKELMSKDIRIKYFYQENCGCPSGPRNLGINKAIGEYIAFLDSDDEWLPTKLEKQLSIFENSNNPKLGIVACYAYIKDHKTGKILYKRDKYSKGNILKELLKDGGLIYTGCVLTKLSILNEIGPFDIDLKISEDLDMWIRIFEKGYEFDYVPEYLFNYLIHDSNMFYGNKDFDKINEFLIRFEKHRQLFLDYDVPFIGDYYFTIKEYKKARKYLIRNLFGNNYSFRQKIRIVGQLIITYYPPAETIWQNIKKLFKK